MGNFRNCGFTVTIFESNLSGHRQGWVKFFAQSLMSDFVHVEILLLLDSPLSETQEVQLRSACNKLSVCIVPVVLRKSNYFFRQLFTYIFMTFYVIRKGNNQLYLVPDYDQLLLPLSILPSLWFSDRVIGIGVRSFFSEHAFYTLPTFTVRIKSFLRKKSFMKSNLFHYFHIDKNELNHIQAVISSECNFDWLPDPLIAGDASGDNDLFPVIDEIFATDDCKVLLVYGDISSRKGVKHLLRSINSTDWPKNVKVLLAGRMSQDVRSYYDEVKSSQLGSGVLFSIDDWIPVQCEKKIFEVAHIVWMGYSDHFGSSGVNKIAAHYRKSVISTHVGLIRTETETYSLGVVLQDFSVNSIVSGVKSCLQHKLDESKVQNFLDTHSPDHCASLVRQSVFSFFDK